MIEFRPTTLEDLKGINELLSQSLAPLMRASYTEAILEVAIPIISKARPELLASGTYFLATTESNKIVGCGGWTKLNPATKKEMDNVGHIRHFATHPDFVRQGIGREIYSLCKNQATEQKITTFECFSSLNAEHFYKSLGFKTIERTSIPLTTEAQFPCLLMRQTL